MACSDKAILKHMDVGRIIIEPFNRENLSTSSYDVTLGEYYYRQQHDEPGSTGIYNLWDEDEVKRVWGPPLVAETFQDFQRRTRSPNLKGIKATDEIIWIRPGETILAHTKEFIGGRESVTTMMKARSSMGRNFVEVCKCAGWGDVGYVNRWTMEITNNSTSFTIPLVVGRRIAQIVFFETEGTIDGASYEKSGKYQSVSTFAELKQKWSPSDMLPKCYLDREVREINKAWKIL